ncbi:uncharacterized protein LOC135954004 [Calliphora vicina]|uniref:uncharacterized protein LOC135953990 n=1 Tax=Calliphora vicina TaxID=7373 RepID=UPI00325C2A03
MASDDRFEATSKKFRQRGQSIEAVSSSSSNVSWIEVSPRPTIIFEQTQGTTTLSQSTSGQSSPVTPYISLFASPTLVFINLSSESSTKSEVTHIPYFSPKRSPESHVTKINQPKIEKSELSSPSSSSTSSSSTSSSSTSSSSTSSSSTSSSSTSTSPTSSITLSPKLPSNNSPPTYTPTTTPPCNRKDHFEDISSEPSFCSEIEPTTSSHIISQTVNISTEIDELAQMPQELQNKINKLLQTRKIGQRYKFLQQIGDRTYRVIVAKSGKVQAQLL